MAMKMDRRAFLKTSAAMAVAVSMTGLLGGCSDSDIGTDLGGFTVAVGKWSAVPHDQGIGTGKSWYSDFTVTVCVHNLDSVNGFSFPAKSVFVLKINGQGRRSAEQYHAGHEKGRAQNGCADLPAG